MILLRFWLRICVAAMLLAATALPAFSAAYWPLSRVPFIDANGDPYAGAKVYFFDEGTTNPRAVYTDKNLSTPHDHPVVANAAGSFAAIYLPQGNYRVRVTTSAGVVIFDDDGITAPLTEQTVEGGTVDPLLLNSTGQVVVFYDSGARDGWVRLNGRTIGNASSSATERANADCEDLFLHLWTIDSNLTVSGGRGASAAADWAANKTITLPDFRERVAVGMSGMGNTALTNLDSQITGANANLLGAVGGVATVTLLTANLPAYTPAGSVSAPSITISGQVAQGVAGTTVATAIQSGSGNSVFLSTQYGTIVASAPVFTGTAQGGTSAAVKTLPKAMMVGVYIKL